MRMKFNMNPSEDTKTAWGYPVEVTSKGVFGEVPDDMVEHEMNAGRISFIETKTIQERIQESKQDRKISAVDVVGEDPVLAAIDAAGAYTANVTETKEDESKLSEGKEHQKTAEEKVKGKRGPKPKTPVIEVTQAPEPVAPPVQTAEELAEINALLASLEVNEGE